MSIIDSLLAKLAPYECLSCGTEGLLLCKACSPYLTTAPPRCYLCRQPSPANQICQSGCHSPLKAAWSAYEYVGLAKDMLWKLKSSGAQMAAREMAQLMATLITEMRRDQGAVIVPVPTATTRVRQRGYDQAKLLAKALARQTHLPYIDCLIRIGQTHQVGASRADRRRQLSGAFRIKPSLLDANMHVILVDDVLTTGATFEAAAAALSNADVNSIVALTFARA